MNPALSWFKRFLLPGFPIVLTGTFIETGTSMIHAFNERVAGSLKALGGTLPAGGAESA
jgi:hypothetical protein